MGETSTLYYDRSKGALPATSKLVFKAGLNRWESIQLVDMARAEGFQQAGGSASDWWSVDITLPQVGTLIWESLPLANVPCDSVVVSVRSEDACTDLIVIQTHLPHARQFCVWLMYIEALGLPCTRLLLQDTFQ